MRDADPAPASKALCEEEIEAYHRDGYVTSNWRLPIAQIERLRKALDYCIAANPNVRPEQLVSVHIVNNGAEGIQGHPAFFELACNDAILDQVSQLIGPDVILWGCQAFCKPARDGREVPWHQDGQYWPIRPLATCTVWLALDASHAANGCLQVIRGSHRGGKVLPHYTDAREDLVLNQALERQHIESEDVVNIELAPGQMSFHDVHLVHGSQPNRSNARRAGIAIRYMPASSIFRRDLYRASRASGYLVDFSQRPLWLLRGEDVSGHNDFSIGH